MSKRRLLLYIASSWIVALGGACSAKIEGKPVDKWNHDLALVDTLSTRLDTTQRDARSLDLPGSGQDQRPIVDLLVPKVDHRPLDAAAPDLLGTPCSEVQPCPKALVCTNRGIVGASYCTTTCDPCVASPCPPGMGCQNLMTGTFICLTGFPNGSCF